jgi:hypothetical protein
MKIILRSFGMAIDTLPVKPYSFYEHNLITQGIVPPSTGYRNAFIECP